MASFLNDNNKNQNGWWKTTITTSKPLVIPPAQTDNVEPQVVPPGQPLILTVPPGQLVILPAQPEVPLVPPIQPGAEPLLNQSHFKPEFASKPD